MSLFTKQKQTLRRREWIYAVAEEAGGKWGVWDGYVHPAILIVDNQQGPTL